MLMESALANGLNCAIIEKSKFGGTCLTKGCIPSKMLVYPADLIRESEKADRVGVSFKKPFVDWEKVSKRMWQQINYSEKMETNLKQLKNLQVFNGTAEFTGEKTLRVKQNDGSYSHEIKGKTIIVAPGSRSFVPPIKNIEQTGYVTSETFFGEKFPKKLWDSVIIVGGGAVSAEFAHIFSSFGTKVTIVETKSRILFSEEEEISAFVEAEFKNNSIDILLNSNVISSKKLNAFKTLTVENTVTKEVVDISADEIFIASGIQSNGDILRLENTDIQTDERGWIKTNEYLETTQKDVYAIGDINGKYQLRHKANYEAEILMHNLFSDGAKKAACYNAVPWAVFTNPQVAHVGMTEREAKNLGIQYWVGKNFFSQIAGGTAMGITDDSSDNGFVKIIVGKEKTILGAHVVGPHASILVQPFVYLMNANHKCENRQIEKIGNIACPQLGSYMPINDSMIIHPSLNELTAWVIGNIDWKDKK